MKATAINVHLDENDEITLRRFEANEQYFIPKPYSCLTIGNALTIFPKSLSQLLSIAEAINKHILDNSPVFEDAYREMVLEPEAGNAD